MTTVVCQGCGLERPAGAVPYDGYYNTSPECWAVYGDVLAREFGDPALFRRVHQLTVDAYALQHAGGDHPDKSIAIHLVGLHLVLERGFEPVDVPPRLQRLARATTRWPHFEPPRDPGGPLTVGDIGAGSHAADVRAWAEQLWAAWAAHHAAITELSRACHGGAPP